MPWNTATVANGVHTLTARARDAAGNTTTSTSVSVTVANPDATAPTVAITAPTGTVSDTVSLSANASDNVGVAGVQFLVDNNPIGAEATTSPYGVSFDTKLVANGTHSLAARARDAAGNVTVSAPVTVSVANLANRQPGANPTGWGDPDVATGVITGSMNGYDTDGDTLTYSVWDPSREGTTIVDKTTGAFTYIPRVSERLKADTTSSYDLDSINVSVSDGVEPANHSMFVQIVPARLAVASPISVGNDPTGVAVEREPSLVLVGRRHAGDDRHDHQRQQHNRVGQCAFGVGRVT